MQGKEDLAAFLSALVSANQELFAAEKLQQCLGSPGFKTACSEGLLDHCHVTDPRGNVSRPLELAARRGYTSVVSELLALGASPALHSHAVTGNTPLHMAVLHGDAKMTSEMVAALQDNGGDVDVPNSNGDTALMFAMHRSAQDMHASTTPILHLMSAGASVTVRNKSGLSALMIACTSTSAGLWKLLVHITKKDIVVQALEDCDVHGNTPLHLAARAGSSAVCESLLSWGANPFSVNNAEESPLDVALTSGHAPTANKLHCARRDAIEATEEAAEKLVQEALAVRDGKHVPMGNLSLPDHPPFSPVRHQSHTGSERADPATHKASGVRMHVERPCIESGSILDTNATTATNVTKICAMPETGSTMAEGVTFSPPSSRPSSNTTAPNSNVPAAAPTAAPKSPAAGARNKTTYKRSSATVLAQHPVCHHRSAIAQFFSSPRDHKPTSVDTVDTTVPPTSDVTTDSQATTNPPTTIDALVDAWQPFTAPKGKVKCVHDSDTLFTTAQGSAHIGLGSYTNSETVITVPMDPRDDSILSSYTRTGDFDTPSAIESSTSAVYHSETLTVPIDPSAMDAHSRVYVVDEPRTAPRDASTAPRRSYHDAARACQGGEGVMASAAGVDTTFASTYESTYEASDDDTVATSVIDTGDRQRRMNPPNTFAPDVVPGAGRDVMQGVMPPASASPMSAAAAAAAVAVMQTAATGSPMTHSGSTHGSGARLRNMFKNSQDLSAGIAGAGAGPHGGSGSDGLRGPPSEAGSVGSSYDNEPECTNNQGLVTSSAPQVVDGGAQHGNKERSAAGRRGQTAVTEAGQSVPSPHGSHAAVPTKQNDSWISHKRSPHNAQRAQDTATPVDTAARAEREESCSSAGGVAMGDAIGMRTEMDEGSMHDSRAVSGAVAKHEGYLLPAVYTGVESLMLEGPGPQACGERDSALDMHALGSSVEGGTSSVYIASDKNDSVRAVAGNTAGSRGVAVGDSKDSGRHIVRNTRESPQAVRAHSARSAKRVLAVLKQKAADGDTKEEEFTPREDMTLDRVMRAAEKMPAIAAAAKRRTSRNAPESQAQASETPNSRKRKSKASASLAAAYGSGSETALAAAAAAAAAGLADSPGGRESSPYAYRLNSSALLMSSMGGNTASTLPGFPPPPPSVITDSFAHGHPGHFGTEETAPTTPPTPLTPHTPSISRTPATPGSCRLTSSTLKASLTMHDSTASHCRHPRRVRPLLTVPQPADPKAHDTPSIQQPRQRGAGEASPRREIVREVSFKDAAVPRDRQTHSPDSARRGASRDRRSPVQLTSDTPRSDYDRTPGDRNCAHGTVQSFPPGQVLGNDGACHPPMHGGSTVPSHSVAATSTAPGTRATTATNSSTSRDASGSILKSCSDLERFSNMSEAVPHKPPAIHTDTDDRNYGAATGAVYRHTEPPHEQSHIPTTQATADRHATHSCTHVEQTPQRYSAMYASAEAVQPPAASAYHPLKAWRLAEQSSQVDLSPTSGHCPPGMQDAVAPHSLITPASAGLPPLAQANASFLFDSAPPELYATWEAGMPIPPANKGALRNRRYPTSRSGLHAPQSSRDAPLGADMNSYASKYWVPSPMSEGGSPYAAEHAGLNPWHSIGAHGEAALPYPEKRGSQGRATVDLNVLWGERSPGHAPASPQQVGTAGREAAVGAALANAGIPLDLAALMGAHPHTLTMPQLEALEDFHYQQLEKISRVKLEKHRELRQKQVQDLRKAAEMWGGLGKA